MRLVHAVPATLLTLTLSITGCGDPADAGPDRDPLGPAAPAEARQLPAGPYDAFFPVVWDIAATADGSILVSQNTTIREIRKGSVQDVATVPSATGVQGLVPVGRRSVLATTGGLDLAVGAAVWHVSNGGVRQLADIEAFEAAHDPDVAGWKDATCELPDFSDGPQSNPYHAAGMPGGALVADAAGNTLLAVGMDGTVELVALFTPPLDGGGYAVLKVMENEPGPADDVTCYVQPVPTSVAVGPEGDYWVGELTGAPGASSTLGWSRVWRIEAGSRDIQCPSAGCEMVYDGFTSIIDVAFGPDGMLYVVEYDENTWLAPLVPAIPLGLGTISRCDPDGSGCAVVEDGLLLPGAITFDKWGDLWVVEGNLTGPAIHRVDTD